MKRAILWLWFSCITCFVFSQNNTQQVTAIQYYFNTDPGVGVPGNGGIITVTPSPDVNQVFSIPLPGTMGEGIHNIYVRAKDEFGKWGLAERRMFFVQSLSQNITTYQYYFESDPGVGVSGNGAVVSVTPTNNFTQTISIPLLSVSEGVHNLYVRTKNSSNSWSIAERRMFFVQRNTQLVTAMEYYFDSDPGPGNGTPIAVSSSQEINAVFDLGVPCLFAGTHYLYIRAKDEFGRWSIIQRDTFSVAGNVTASIVYPQGPLTICGNDAVTLSFTPNPGVSYQWLLNGNDISGATGNTYSVNAAGNYSVKATCGSSNAISNIVSVTTLPLNTYYADSDGDGYGNPAVTIQGCTAPSGYVVDQTDCNDNNQNIHPGATEVCNGIDDDCDGQTDEGGSNTFYRDLDGDGYGNASVTLQSCSAPTGYVSNNSDCNDNNSNIYPGAPEVCNETDDDCDGQIDEGVTSTFYRDLDGDGYGNAAVMVQACSAPSGYVSNNSDCNDGNNAIHPGAVEICGNGTDENCNGQADEGCCNLTVNAGPDENLYYGYALDQCATKTASIVNGTATFIYSWTLDRALLPGESITGANTATVTVCLMDTAQLCLTVTDANNCTAIDCAMMFGEDVRCFAGNNQKVKICHNGTTICVDQNAVAAHLAHGDYVGRCTGPVAYPDGSAIEESSEAGVTLYPNPATNQITIRNSNHQSLGTVSIYDISGKMIYKKFVGSFQTTIELKNLSAGVFYIRSDQIPGAIKFVRM